jgi:hypothetical protein
MGRPLHDLLAIGAALALAAPVGSAEAIREEIALIAAASWEGFDQIDLPTLRRVYLGSQTRLAGRRPIALHLPSGSAAREGFSHTALGRSAEDLERHWMEQALLGGALPPREVASAEAMISAVRARRGAIGYVPVRELTDAEPRRVRVLAIVRDARAARPGDPGYPLYFPAVD